MLESLKDPKLGENVIKSLRAMADLPAHGVVAGQAVASLVDRFTGKGAAPINDIDLFVLVPHPLELKDPEAVSIIMSTSSIDLMQLDPYANLGSLGVNEQSAYQISSVKREGLLNTIYYSTPWVTKNPLPDRKWEMRDLFALVSDRVGRIIGAFDINCTQIGLDLASGKLVWTRDFEFFWKTRQLEVCSAHTPLQTAIRLVKKNHELENSYLNEHQQLNGLAAILHNLNELSRLTDTLEKRKYEKFAATKFMGDGYLDKFELAKSNSELFRDLFSYEIVKSEKSDKIYYKGNSKKSPLKSFTQDYYEIMSNEFIPGLSNKHLTFKVKFLAGAYIKLLKTEGLRVPKNTKKFIQSQIKLQERTDASLSTLLSLDEHLTEKDSFSVKTDSSLYSLVNSDKSLTVGEILRKGYVDESNSENKLPKDLNLSYLANLVEYGPDCYSKKFDSSLYKKSMDFFYKKHSLSKLNVNKKNPADAISFYLDFIEKAKAYPFFVGILESYNQKIQFSKDSSVDDLLEYSKGVHARSQKRIRKLKSRFSPEIPGVNEILDGVTLSQEGKDMCHCVSGYLTPVSRGVCRIISLKVGDGSNKNLNRGTMELRPHSVKSFIKSNNKKSKGIENQKIQINALELKYPGITNESIWVPAQLKGFANKKVSDPCKELAAQYCLALNKDLLDKLRDVLGESDCNYENMIQSVTGANHYDFKTKTEGNNHQTQRNIEFFLEEI